MSRKILLRETKNCTLPKCHTCDARIGGIKRLYIHFQYLSTIFWVTLIKET